MNLQVRGNEAKRWGIGADAMRECMRGRNVGVPGKKSLFLAHWGQEGSTVDTFLVSQHLQREGMKFFEE